MSGFFKYSPAALGGQYNAGGGGGGGTVTSVGLADNSTTPIYAISNSPITSSGTLTMTLGTQSANFIFAGPTTGAAAQPTFRALVTADMPSSVVLTSGNQTIAGTKTFSATISGTTSGNTTYTANQFGVVASGSANAMSVIAPDVSTTKVLVSGGTAALPSWQDIATGALALGAFGSTPNSKGATLSGATLTLQPADDLNPGHLSISAQNFGGVKTFVAAPVFSTVTASQALVVDSGKSLTSVAYTNANTASALVQRDASGNFSAGTITAALTGTASGNATLTPTQFGVVVSTATNTLGVITPDSSTTKVLVSGGSGANPSWQSIAGTALSLGSFGVAPNSSGATLSGSTLTLQPADGTNPGGLTAGAQTIGGVKTFSSAPIFSSTVASQALIVDGSKALSSIGYAAANTPSYIVQRDGFGDFVARTPTVTSVKYSGSTSGTTTLQSNATASGTLTLPAATDTLVGQATTDTLTNKTISTGGTNVIGSTTVSGTTGSTNVVFSGSPTIATPTITTSATVPLIIGGTTASSSLELRSTSGTGSTDFIKFTVGTNGGTEAMRILSSGRVGIGVSPAAPLDVNGGAHFVPVTTTGGASYNGGTSVLIGSSSDMGAGSYGMFGIGVPAGGAVYPIVVQKAGALLFQVSFNGDVFALGTYTSTSDRRLKKDVRKSDLGLSFINKLNPVSYRWNSTDSDSDLHYGLIAQETEEVLREASSPDDDKTKSIVHYDKTIDRYGIRYTELIAPIIKALQELHSKCVGKDEEIKKLKLRASKAEEEIAVIKSYLCLKDPNASFKKEN